jgi:hypothetical protein
MQLRDHFGHSVQPVLLVQRMFTLRLQTRHFAAVTSTRPRHCATSRACCTVRQSRTGQLRESSQVTAIDGIHDTVSPANGVLRTCCWARSL